MIESLNSFFVENSVPALATREGWNEASWVQYLSRTLIHISCVHRFSLNSLPIGPIQRSHESMKSCQLFPDIDWIYLSCMYMQVGPTLQATLVAKRHFANALLEFSYVKLLEDVL